MTKDALVSFRVTPAKLQEYEDAALLSGKGSANLLAAALTDEGVRRTRFPVIDFRDGQPGRVAYLSGTRWPVWLIVQLIEEYKGDLGKAARQMNKPRAIIDQAARYAKAYPDEIQAAWRLADKREEARE